MILVTIYGISGCCRNRFGNVVAFEEINRKSRESMLKAKAVAEAGGFRIIYGAVDSLFVSRLDAGREDYEALAAEIARATDLPMSLDRHFRFLAFLPLKGDPSSSALNRYFGLTYDGKVEARGIELRRSDTPEIVRAFQAELIRRVFNSGDLQEACTEGVLRGMALLRLAVNKIRGGDVDAGDLVVRKRLGKGIGEYTASVSQRSAALQLLHADKEIEVGDDIPFIYTDHDNGNPLCRVRAPELFSGSYDREIYARMLLDAASTVWRGMGFNPDLKPTASTLDRWLQPEA
jgi:DNA polymerase elongation subunit (family B)